MSITRNCQIVKVGGIVSFWCNFGLQIGILGLCRAEARRYKTKISHHEVGGTNGILLNHSRHCGNPPQGGDRPPTERQRAEEHD
jgi:hypothetical protein